MSNPSAWRSHLRTPRPCDHFIQLYTDDAFLERVVGEYIGNGLGAGEGAVLVATPRHTFAFERQLAAAGHDPRAAQKHGQLVILYADQCLGRFMRGDKPDPQMFRAFVHDTLDAVRAAGFLKIRVFGEMVDLLWKRNLEATIHLEELWNEALADEQVSILCAYGIDNFDGSAHRGPLHRISRAHSHLIPVEDYARLDLAVERACDEVFGGEKDGGRVRMLLSSSHQQTVMPRSEAALLALRDLPESVAESVLARARHHYRS
jgi:hypothetical protein